MSGSNANKMYKLKSSEADILPLSALRHHFLPFSRQNRPGSYIIKISSQAVLHNGESQERAHFLSEIKTCSYIGSLKQFMHVKILRVVKINLSNFLTDSFNFYHSHFQLSYLYFYSSMTLYITV